MRRGSVRGVEIIEAEVWLLVGPDDNSREE